VNSGDAGRLLPSADTGIRYFLPSESSGGRLPSDASECYAMCRLPSEGTGVVFRHQVANRITAISYHKALRNVYITADLAPESAWPEEEREMGSVSAATLH
jgi:hypothetical protein